MESTDTSSYRQRISARPIDAWAEIPAAWRDRPESANLGTLHGEPCQEVCESVSLTFPAVNVRGHQERVRRFTRLDHNPRTTIAQQTGTFTCTDKSCKFTTTTNDITASSWTSLAKRFGAVITIFLE